MSIRQWPFLQFTLALLEIRIFEQAFVTYAMLLCRLKMVAQHCNHTVTILQRCSNVTCRLDCCKWSHKQGFYKMDGLRDCDAVYLLSICYLAILMCNQNLVAMKKEKGVKEFHLFTFAIF